MLEQKDVLHVAKLARLQISEEEAKLHANQLTKALGFFEQIAKIKTEGVEPLVTPTDIPVFWRSDEVKVEITAEEALQNAPSRVGQLFSVPPVV